VGAAGCGLSFGTDGSSDKVSGPGSLIAVESSVVTISGLQNNSVYLCKVNLSASPKSASLTGFVNNTDVQPDPASRAARSAAPAYDDAFPLPGHPAALAFAANPPPLPEAAPRAARAASAPVERKVGDSHDFLVENWFGSYTFESRTAYLRAQGAHVNIWVMGPKPGEKDLGNYTENTKSPKTDRKITAAQAQTLADKFDLLYGPETNLLGYEYGGGPGGDGGKDGDTRIQILIYDLLNEDDSPSNAAGFFWAKDFYSAGSNGSNQAEMFYLDTDIVDGRMDYACSALAHEFQHMINWNEKTVKHGKSPAAWYNEMLSEMAEDALASFINLSTTNAEHPVNTRIPRFLVSYSDIGITDWNDLGSEAYAKAYAFGAYLMRNLGGPALLGEILRNDAVDVDSLTKALAVKSPGMDFEQAVTRFGEALMFSGAHKPESTFTFDVQVSSTVNGITYTLPAFDIWTIRQIDSTNTGPKITASLEQKGMPGYSLALQTTLSWKNRTGDLTVSISTMPDVKMIFMAR
jgi:hypothetical protein